MGVICELCGHYVGVVRVFCVYHLRVMCILYECHLGGVWVSFWRHVGVM